MGGPTVAQLWRRPRLVAKVDSKGSVALEQMR